MTQTTQPYLRSQLDLLNEFKVKMKLGATARWSDIEFYTAMNEALVVWAEKVKVPHLYTIPGGWSAGIYAYALPNYVRPPLVAQVKRPIPYEPWGLTTTSAYTWTDIPSSTEPDGEGGLILRLPTASHTWEGRVLFQAPNSRIPTTATLPTTSGSTAADATTILLGSVVDVDDVGHVRINGEYKAYSGVTRGVTTTTLLNVLPGLYGSTAAIHADGSSVQWCIAADTLRLYEHFYNFTAYVLHRYFQTDGGVHERSNHQQMMLYHKQMADETWQTYKPQRPQGKLVLNNRVLGIR